MPESFSASEFSEFLKMALRAGKLAEAEILKHFERGVSVEWKADLTPVTIADKKAEEVMRNFLLSEMPGAGFIGEEFGVESPEAKYQWIIDPIDGTKSFIRGVPLFGTLIALYRRDEPLVSVVNLPAEGRALYAAAGMGAFVDSKRVSCSKIKKLSDALVLSGTLNTIEKLGLGKAFTKLRQKASLYRGWGDCYGYFLVASGRAEVMVDPVVSLWDIAPFPLLFQEAGGKFSTLSGEMALFDSEGKPLHSIYEGYTAIASNAFLADEALQILQNKKED